MVLLLVPLVLLVGAGCGGHTTSPADVLASDIAARMRSAALKNGVQGRVALAGARLFGESGCANCHVYGGVGSTNLGAPELTAEGSKGKSAAELVAFLRCPQCSDSQSSMPPFKALGERNLRKLAIFLEASKGGG